MTAERPILFTGEMVRAILDDRKHMTRRVVKPQPVGPFQLNSDCSIGEVHPETGPRVQRCPYGQPGDLLVPRTTWAAPPKLDHLKPLEIAEQPKGSVPIWNHWVLPEKPGGFGKPRPGRFLPRGLWWSVPRLSVTGVRVDRVQDISEADAKAEGLIPVMGDGSGPGAGFKWDGVGYHGGRHNDAGAEMFHTPGCGGKCACNAGGPTPAQCAFRNLWDSINGKRPGCSWSDNPWVWAPSFERTEPHR